MDNLRTNIAIVEPSDIIYEGIVNILLKNESHYYIFRALTIDELNILCAKENLHVVILNPNLIINRGNDFSKLKKTYTTMSWIGLIYSYFDSELMMKFDDIINITDPETVITKKLSRSSDKCYCHDTNQEDLSEREIEVLIELIKGLSNKEIADTLNISVHTVISHRKNIIDKTGIKSLSGLTIYAISKKIMQIDQVS